MNKPDAEKIPDWKLERFLLAELPPMEMRRIKKRAASDPNLAEAIKVLGDVHRDLLAAHPSGPMAEGIASRLDKEPAQAWDWQRLLPRGRSLWVPALALLALSALPVLLFRGEPGVPAGMADPLDGRIKGSRPEIFLYRKTAQGTEQLRPDQRVHPGDRVQVYYDAAGIAQGMVFSVDAEGNVTWHFPEGGNRQSAPLKQGGRVPLGFSFELDASSWEKFYFIVSDRPFSLDSLGNGDGPLPKGFNRSIFTLFKGSKT